MKRIVLFVTVTLFSVCSPAIATIIDIPDDYSTIQEGINASSDGDTVLVQPDTYVDNISFGGHNIVLGSLLLITGDTSYISSTIIDGNSQGSVIYIANISTATITGFTLRNGYYNYGGAIYCSESNPLIEYNKLTGNSSFYGGGGIYCRSGSNPIIRDNTITGNSSEDDGGGIWVYESDPIISNNIISENNARSGGGIGCSGSDATISNNEINDNNATFGGGGIYCYGAAPTITNNMISGNQTNSGGGISLFGNSNPIISENIIKGNTASVSAEELTVPALIQQ